MNVLYQRCLLIYYVFVKLFLFVQQLKNRLESTYLQNDLSQNNQECRGNKNNRTKKGRLLTKRLKDSIHLVNLLGVCINRKGKRRRNTEHLFDILLLVTMCIRVRQCRGGGTRKGRAVNDFADMSRSKYIDRCDMKPKQSRV